MEDWEHLRMATQFILALKNILVDTLLINSYIMF